MQISPISVNRPAGEEPAIEETAGANGKPLREAPPVEHRPVRAEPLRGGLPRWNPQLNQQISTAQQSLVFLQEAESRLQGLKSELSARLAADQAGDGKLAAKLRDFADFWRQRRTLSGAALDGELGYSPDSRTRQRFRIKGLDRDSLRSGGRETLAFSVGGGNPRLLVVALEPGLTEAEIARRFDRAFAPAGIRVALDEAGEMSFSVPEADWATVQDTLAVRGAGIRFPSGQMTRARAEGMPEAVRAGTWQGSDALALRRTLQEVVDALARVRQVRETLARALADARLQLNDVAPGEEGTWAFAFAADFEAMASEPAYQVYSSVAPALASISRDRVLSLLALD